VVVVEAAGVAGHAVADLAVGVEVMAVASEADSLPLRPVEAHVVVCPQEVVSGGPVRVLEWMPADQVPDRVVLEVLEVSEVLEVLEVSDALAVLEASAVLEA
jgi:hypothetical protein